MFTMILMKTLADQHETTKMEFNWSI